MKSHTRVEVNIIKAYSSKKRNTMGAVDSK